MNCVENQSLCMMVKIQHKISKPNFNLKVRVGCICPGYLWVCLFSIRPVPVTVYTHSSLQSLEEDLPIVKYGLPAPKSVCHSN